MTIDNGKEEIIMKALIAYSEIMGGSPKDALELFKEPESIERLIRIFTYLLKDDRYTMLAVLSDDDFETVLYKIKEGG